MADTVEMIVRYEGDDISGLALEQVGALVWACLRKQAYAEGTLACVFVERRPATYYIEARAKEPDGPPIRLLDLEVPLGGVEPAKFAEFVRAEGLAPYLVPPKGSRVAAADPRLGRASVGRNDPCPCGSGKKYKKCCLA